MSFSFPRSSRLLNKKHYDYVFQSANKIGTRYLTVLYRQNTFDYPRLGLIVAKKTAKLAHDRNRFKRIAREYFRLAQDQLPNVDIVILSRQHIETAANHVLVGELAYVWKKIITGKEKRAI